MTAQEPATWQQLLGQLIASPQVHMHLAQLLHVRPITLQRWSEGVSRPRFGNIRQLLKHIPREKYALFLRLLLIDFPELLQDTIPDERFSGKIPTEFYERVLSSRAHTPVPIYHQSMKDLLLQQLLLHLDPDRQGLSVTLVCCVPPRLGKKVRSLHDIGGMGTPPWPHDVLEKPIFLGCESLIGYALTHGHPCAVNSQDEVTLLPVQWGEHERSLAAFPIRHSSRIVGGLTVASAFECFFLPPRLAVLEEYANLATCIFEPEVSYALNDLELRVMPPYASQRPYFAGYTQRISRKLEAVKSTGEQITWQQARQLVWQDLEDILLQILWQVEAEHLS